MTYLQLRLIIYNNELRQMFASIKQLFIFIVLLLHIAFPIAVLAALISLSIIESSQAENSTRIFYQWGYFVFLFFLIRIQKKAIFGEAWRLYLASIPSTKTQKYYANIMLIGLAGNLPLLVPIVIVISSLDSSILTNHLYFTLFAVAPFFVAWLALKRRRFPWLSLLLFPLAMSFYVTQVPELLSARALNSYWLLVLLIDCLYCIYSPITVIKKSHHALKSYWQITWIDIIESPSPLLSRVFFCGLFIVMVGYVQGQLGAIATEELQAVFCYILSLVIGSFQFDNEKFNLRYRYYLASLLLNVRQRYLFDIIPAILIACVVAVALTQYLSFSFLTFIILPVGTAITMMSVTKYKRNFFIVPGVIFTFLVALS